MFIGQTLRAMQIIMLIHIPPCHMLMQNHLKLFLMTMDRTLKMLTMFTLKEG